MCNDVKEAEVLILEALKYYEIRISDQINEEEPQKVYIESRTTRKISTILEFLAEIYEMKKE